MSRPIDLVRSLTADGLASLRSDVAAGRAEHALKSLRQRDAGAEIVREQYAGRYPLELVQNANDAVATDGVEEARIKFVVTKSALLVADTGAGFGTAQVESICDLAQSSKDPRKSVGYKGLGFKSVAEITDTPQVISGDLRFGFDRARLRREVEAIVGRDLGEDFPLPDYAFPFELSDVDFGQDAGAVSELQEQGFRTVMRLPFRDRVAADAAVTHVAETIVPRLLLFLDATESLELVGTPADFHAQALREGGDEQQYVILEAKDRSEQFAVYRTIVPIPDPALVSELGKAWRQVEAVRISAAAPLDDAGHLRATSAEPLHVYFPTEEETGLSIIFNADFQVELDRRRIAASGAPGNYNLWLTDQLAEFVAKVVVPDLTDRFGGAATVDVFAPHASATHTGERVTSALFRALRDVAWIPCQDGELRLPADVRMLPTSVPSVADLHEWLKAPELVQLEVEADNRARSLLANVFDCDEVPEATALSCLRPPPASEAVRFYDFLVAWAQHAPYGFGGWLQRCRCVLLQGGEWVRPTDDPTPFLPRQRAEEEFPPGLRIPVADLPDVDGVVDLLERAGMEPLTWRSLVADFLLPRLTDRDVEAAERGDALAILRNYFDSIRRDGTGDREIRESVGEALLPARGQGSSTSVELRPARRLYFGSDWLPDARLEALYGPLGGVDFLAVESTLVEQDRSFYEWLGVQSHPGVVELQHHGGLTSWRYGSACQKASVCPQGHPQSQRLQAAPMIDRLDVLVASGDAVRLSILWRHLVAEWDSRYRNALVATWRCVAGAHNVLKHPRDRSFDSAAGALLKTEAWIPAMRSGRSVLAAPGEVWRPAPGSPSAVTSLLTTLIPHGPRPTLGMAEALGMVDAARADASAIVQLLVQLEHDVGELPALPDDVADACRWLLAQLEDAEGVEGLKQGSVPLVARVRSAARLVRGPFVVRDALLADVWSDTVAVYDGDTHLPRVFAALNIPILDEQVEVTPLPADRLQDVERAVRAQLNKVGPALLATTAVDYGSRRDDAARRLRALKLVCTSELGLKYSLKGHSPRRARGAHAFIYDGSAYLQVEEGEPDWSAFGLRLADHLAVPLGDAFALLLDASPRGRQNYLQARHISDEDLQGAEEVLDADDETTDLHDHAAWHYGEEPEPDADAGHGGADDPDVKIPPAADPGHDQGRGVGRGERHSGTMEGARESDGTSFEDGDASRFQQDSSSAARGAAGSNAAVSRGLDSDKTDSQPLSRFYSYVAAAGSREARMAERQEARAIRLGEHGVQRVVEYEAARGRTAEPQPHNNKGFDIISSGPDGSDRRIIEVKATARDWPDRGVPVSDSQIDKNREVGDEFWLYVVEHAEDPESARVTAIQNPIAAVDYFAFDPGWSVLGET